MRHARNDVALQVLDLLQALNVETRLSAALYARGCVDTGTSESPLSRIRDATATSSPAMSVMVGRTSSFEGVVVQDTGGLRKLRWAGGGSGKRGGVRVIYFHATLDGQIRFLLTYRKGVKDDLSAAEKRVLRTLNANW